MKKISDTSHIIKSKRQSPSLKCILTRARFSSKNQEPPTIKKCDKSRCSTCPYLTVRSTFHFKTGSDFSIKTSMSCTSSNLIYVIRCVGCGENILVRQKTHWDTGWPYTDSDHLRNCAKNKNPNLTVFPFYKFLRNTTEKEREAKKMFIIKYKPVLNA